MNLGFESQFARFDNRVRVSGCSVSVRNGLLVDSVFEDKGEEGRNSSWKWARCSNTVKKARKLEADFTETVKASNKIALLKKEGLKKKKCLKMFNQTEICIHHK